MQQCFYALNYFKLLHLHLILCRDECEMFTSRFMSCMACFLPEEYGSVASTPDSTPPCTDGNAAHTWHFFPCTERFCLTLLKNKRFLPPESFSFEHHIRGIYLNSSLASKKHKRWRSMSKQMSYSDHSHILCREMIVYFSKEGFIHFKCHTFFSLNSNDKITITSFHLS